MVVASKNKLEKKLKWLMKCKLMLYACPLDSIDGQVDYTRVPECVHRRSTKEFNCTKYRGTSKIIHMYIILYKEVCCQEFSQ